MDADELETTFGNVLDKSLGYQKVFNEVVLDDWGHTSEGTKMRGRTISSLRSSNNVSSFILTRLASLASRSLAALAQARAPPKSLNSSSTSR